MRFNLILISRTDFTVPHNICETQFHTFCTLHSYVWDHAHVAPQSPVNHQSPLMCAAGSGYSGPVVDESTIEGISCLLPENILKVLDGVRLEAAERAAEEALVSK